MTNPKITLDGIPYKVPCKHLYSECVEERYSNKLFGFFPSFGTYLKSTVNKCNDCGEIFEKPFFNPGP